MKISVFMSKLAWESSKRRKIKAKSSSGPTNNLVLFYVFFLVLFSVVSRSKNTKLPSESNDKQINAEPTEGAQDNHVGFKYVKAFRLRRWPSVGAARKCYILPPSHLTRSKHGKFMVQWDSGIAFPPTIFIALLIA